ncbi:hypothetical protein ACDX78_01050 [Virgibacillus oceani]
MSVAHYHGLCQRYMGRPVEVRMKDGKVHRGIIKHVDGRNVYLQPLGGAGGLGGFGWGWGWGIGGFGIGLALGGIVGLALLPLFFI